MVTYIQEKKKDLIKNKIERNKDLTAAMQICSFYIFVKEWQLLWI